MAFAGQPTGAAKDEKSDDAASTDAAATQRDPLLDTLPKELAELRLVRRLNSESFDPTYDGNFLREALMLRDIESHVESDSLDPLARATALFDWTVRNIQIEPQPTADAPPADQWLARHLPLEMLYFGRGTPLQRAWVFMLLARQANLDVVLLATPEPRNPEVLRPWAAALVSGGELYLFDFTYGLPIPGPKGEGIATLSQAAADDSILRQMDTADRVYPRKAADLEKVTALLEASPGYLSRRMKLLESQLARENRMVLSTSPSEVAAKLHDTKHVGEVKLWPLPFTTLEQRATATPELLHAAQLERLPFSIAADPEESKKKQQDDQKNAPPKLHALRLGRLLHLRGIYGGSSKDQPADSSGPELSAVAEHGAKFYYLRRAAERTAR